MMSTGDIQGGLRSLEALLRGIKYPGEVNYSGLSKGDPSAFLPIMSFTLTSFSPLFTEQLMAAGLELTGKTDLRFTDALYKMLRDIFHYKPILTKQQFLQWGFSQRKISMLCDVITMVMQRHKQLKKPKVKGPTSVRVDGEAAPAHPDNVVSSPVVVSHKETPASLRNSSQAEALPSFDSSHQVFSSEFSCPENWSTKQLDTDGSLHLTEVEERLSAVESQLNGVMCELSRLSVLERRLQHVEEAGGTEKGEGEVITISKARLENLMNRLLLLETKLELSSNAQAAVLLQQSSSSSPSVQSSSVNDASKEDYKDSMERIANMIKSTSSLLKTSDSCTTP